MMRGIAGLANRPSRAMLPRSALPAARRVGPQSAYGLIFERFAAESVSAEPRLTAFAPWRAWQGVSAS